MRWIFCSICVLFCLAAAGQKSYRLQFIGDSIAQKALKLTTSFATKDAALQYLHALPKNLVGKGYLAASVDSVQTDSLQARVFLYTGKKYHWGRLSVPAKYQPLVKHGDGRGNNRIGTDLPDQILDALAAEGYPFASVGFDSVTIAGDTLQGVLVVDEGNFYKIDSVHINGLRLMPTFVYPYLHMQKGMAYNQQAIDRIDSRMQELPFAEIVQPAQVEMTGSGSAVQVFLRPRRSNIINALIGIAPASTQTPGNKLLLSGDVNILLRNAFYAGETIGVNWQQLQYKSPRLSLQFAQPYMFGTKAGMDLGFELFKKDTQFVNINFRLGIPYDFTGQKAGKIFFQQLATNVTFVDTLAVKTNRRLPDLASVSSANMGLEYEWNTTDYRANPRRGFDLLFTGTAGIKKIKKDNAITVLKDAQDAAFNFGSLYDTVSLRSYQFRLKGRLAQYLRTGRQTVLKLALNGGWYQSQNYFRNELFQIGGFRLLRGFDEESIYANRYAVGTAEYRFLTGRNAFFFAFADGGITGYQDQQRSFSNRYLGAGLGLSVETKNSLVNLSWAVGKRDDTPLNLRQSRIHLGFVNYF